MIRLRKRFDWSQFGKNFDKTVPEREERTDYDALAVMLKKLPENQRNAIVLRYFGDYSDDEIAERLHTTSGNVRVIIHRGIIALKSERSFKELL